MMSEVHLGCPPNLSGPQISRVIFSLPPVEPVDRKYMDAFKDQATSTHQVVSLDKDDGSKPTLFVKLYLSPIVVHLGDPRVGYDQSSNFNHGGYTSTSHMSSALMEKTYARCEEFTLSSEFGHGRKTESSVESSLAKKPHKKQVTLLSVTKYASIIPEKVGPLLKMSLHGLDWSEDMDLC